ncbi:MAG: class II D-tagatose-bisphosphate aldolase, non-catalytic subunit [Desulfobacterales bacterium]
MDINLEKLKEKHRRENSGGVVSVCSAHPVVLEAAIEAADREDRPLLIEATANQVNQFGGYTGMTPAAFAAIVNDISAKAGAAEHPVLIGSDHLGPHIWKDEPFEAAMRKAGELVEQCIRAGYGKIHLDTGKGCADDGDEGLSIEEAARRAARLCEIAETTAQVRGDSQKPLYVIGNEVPSPGGGLQEGERLIVTDPDQLRSDLTAYHRAFEERNLASAWRRVIAVVVQPGVDFGDDRVAVYRSERAAALSEAHADLPGKMTYEIHATDYQPPEALRHMVKDHFMLLKVGPCLTFAMRRALYALSRIENELPKIQTPSNLIGVMEKIMTENPAYWQSYYRGNEAELRFLRHYSLRDRIRYYWTHPEAQAAVSQLLHNLRRPLPGALLHQYLPDIFPEVAAQSRHGDCSTVIKTAIQKTLTTYCI